MSHFNFKNVLKQNIGSSRHQRADKTTERQVTIETTNEIAPSKALCLTAPSDVTAFVPVAKVDTRQGKRVSQSQGTAIASQIDEPEVDVKCPTSAAVRRVRLRC